MVCNTGIGLIPRIDGQVHTFTEQGLYDGLFLIVDHETGTYWNHVSGEAVHGELVGERLELENVLHTSVRQVLAEHPDAILAWSEHPSALERVEDGASPLSRFLSRIRSIPGRFIPTLGSEDGRRDRMEIGLGIWDDERARYYPMPVIEAMDNVVFDRFGDSNVLVYHDPTSFALSAERTDATSATWDGDVLRLSNGDYVRDGILFGPDDERKERDRPLQVFTRWYGFSLTFPQTEVYEGAVGSGG